MGRLVVVGKAHGATALGVPALVQDDLCPVDVAVLLEKVLKLLHVVGGKQGLRIRVWNLTKDHLDSFPSFVF